MVRVIDILNWIDSYAPFHYAASWDQCGLQVGDPQSEVTRTLVALDPTSRVLSEAEELKCQCLVSHHPLLFQPLKTLRFDEYPGALVARAVKSGIHMIAVHTNLDAALGGTNHFLAALFGIRDVQPLEVDKSLQGEPRYLGMGGVGLLEEVLSLKSLMEKAQRVLGLEKIKAVGDPSRNLRRVAFCTGSGGSLIGKAVESGADVYLTGDIKYHEAQRALETGLAVVDIGHFASERIIVAPLAAYLREEAKRRSQYLEVMEAGTENDPFWYWTEEV